MVCREQKGLDNLLPGFCPKGVWAIWGPGRFCLLSFGENSFRYRLVSTVSGWCIIDAVVVVVVGAGGRCGKGGKGGARFGTELLVILCRLAPDQTMVVTAACSTKHRVPE